MQCGPLPWGTTDDLPPSVVVGRAPSRRYLNLERQPMFKAKYDGRCPSCDEPISQGEDVTMVDSDRGRVTVHAHHVDDGEIHIETGPRADHTTGTMPRGRTVSDRCGVCFQIPASNGDCGCSF